MAVDPRLRRQGIARALLAACDAAAAAAPRLGAPPARADVYLHVRGGDAAARALYSSFGYEEVEKEAPAGGGGGGLLGFALGGGGSGGAKQRGRVLMRRRVPAAS